MAKLDIHPGISHSPEELSTHQGMAFFGNTGPIGMVCNDCGHYRRGGCLKFVDMTKQKLVRFPREAMACKYFVTTKYKISKPPKQEKTPLFGELPEQRKAAP